MDSLPKAELLQASDACVHASWLQGWGLHVHACHSSCNELHADSDTASNPDDRYKANAYVLSRQLLTLHRRF